MLNHMSKLKKKNCILMLLTFFWIIFSFALFYYLINQGGSYYFSKSFIKYLIFFQPISTLGLAYVFTGGRLLETKNKIKPIIASTAILIVFAFTMMQWMSTINNYGQYGTYIKNAHEFGATFLLNYDGDTNFEKETIAREGYKYKYYITFQKIWIFDFTILASTFLLLYSLNNKEKNT